MENGWKIENLVDWQIYDIYGTKNNIYMNSKDKTWKMIGIDGKPKVDLQILENVAI